MNLVQTASGDGFMTGENLTEATVTARVWPTNNGFAEEPQTTFLKAGTIIDRYGDENGYFFAPEGTPFDARSLPADYECSGYTSFRVEVTFPVQSGTIAPWFGQPGGGMQYFTGNIGSTTELINAGYLSVVH